jgi:hypothetical protein
MAPATGLKLKLGKKGHCFHNAWLAVAAHPKELYYVEGYIYGRDLASGNTEWLHHGWWKKSKLVRRTN